MLTSIALIFLLGLLLSTGFQKLKLPILITAPFGAICMDRLYKRLLSQ